MSRREGEMITVFETVEEKKERLFKEKYMTNRELPSFVRHD